LAKQAGHLPFTRLERRKPLIERSCFSHVPDHKSNSIGCASDDIAGGDHPAPAVHAAGVPPVRFRWQGTPQLLL
jgi:hypothetical protein